MPFNSRTKNATQFVGLVISALVAFSGLVLNYLNSALEIARLSRTGKEEGLKRDITNLKAALAAITLGSIALAILFAVIKTARKGLKHRAAIAKKLCFCCRKKGRTHGRGSGRDGGDVDSDVEGGGSRTGVRAVELGALSFNPLHARRGGGAARSRSERSWSGNPLEHFDGKDITATGRCQSADVAVPRSSGSVELNQSGGEEVVELPAVGEEVTNKSGSSRLANLAGLESYTVDAAGYAGDGSSDDGGGVVIRDSAEDDISDAGNNLTGEESARNGKEDGGAVDAEWQAHVDEDTGDTYWCHVHTGESTWHKPSSISESGGNSSTQHEEYSGEENEEDSGGESVPSDGGCSNFGGDSKTDTEIQANQMHSVDRGGGGEKAPERRKSLAAPANSLVASKQRRLSKHDCAKLL